jgi:hypothetical protein
MTKAVALLLGAMVAIAASLGPAVAQGNQTAPAVSLPIAATGPATDLRERLHTVPRLPLGSDPAAEPLRVDQIGPALQGPPEDGIVTVKQ